MRKRKPDAPPESWTKSKSLKIEPVEVPDNDIKSPPMMDKVHLTHPFSLAAFGGSGSGKTVFIVNLLTKKEMYGKYFDEIYLYAPTGKCDESFEYIDIPKERVVYKDFIPKLKLLLEKAQREVEQVGLSKVKKRCIVFEDLTSLRKLMNSSEFMQCFVMARHYGISVIASCHKFKALERCSRLNAKHFVIFPAPVTEIKALLEEHQPACLSKKEFVDMVQYCWKPEPDNPRPFMWIKAQQPPISRFSKSMTHEIVLKNCDDPNARGKLEKEDNTKPAHGTKRKSDEDATSDAVPPVKVAKS